MNCKFLSKTQLFTGCSEQEITLMLNCLSYALKNYKKGHCICHSGQIIKDVCLVISGSVQIENIDILGNKSILGISEAGDIFAESYACTGQPMLVDVIAREDSEILLINIPKLFSVSSACSHSAKLIQNLLQISSRKNLNLSMRIFHTAPKTIRARLYSYFSEQIALQGSNDIIIPLDRQQLADYLETDRSALSKELGKMRDEGLLTFHKNVFHLIVK